MRPSRRDAGGDVGRHLLERVLGGVHADDLEPGGGVVLGPGLDVRKLALAVDAGVGPEVDEDDLAVERGQAQRLAAGGVQPLLDAGEAGRGAALLHSGAAVQGRRLAVLQGYAAAATLGCGRGALFQGVAQGLGVVRDVTRNDVREVERQRDGQDDHHRTADRAEGTLVTPESAEPLSHAAARKREGEQRYRGADGEAQGETDRAEADVAGRACHGDGGKDRPRARHEDRAEGDTEDEAVAAGARCALGKPIEGPLDQVPERRHKQSEPDEPKHGQAEPADRVGWQVQASQNEAAEKGKDPETQRQAEDDEIGPPPRRLRVRLRAAAAEEDDGKHRQDARGQARDDPADQPDQHQRHATTSSRRPGPGSIRVSTPCSVRPTEIAARPV